MQRLVVIDNKLTEEDKAQRRQEFMQALCFGDFKTVKHRVDAFLRKYGMPEHQIDLFSRIPLNILVGFLNGDIQRVETTDAKGDRVCLVSSGEEMGKKGEI